MMWFNQGVDIRISDHGLKLSPKIAENQYCIVFKYLNS